MGNSVCVCSRARAYNNVFYYYYYYYAGKPTGIHRLPPPPPPHPTWRHLRGGPLLVTRLVGRFFSSLPFYTACVVVFARARARSYVFVRVSFKAKTPRRVGCVLSRSAECARARASNYSFQWRRRMSVPSVCRLAVWRLRLCRSFSRRYLVRLVVVHTPLFLDRRLTSPLTVKTLNFLFSRITLGFEADRPTRKTNILISFCWFFETTEPPSKRFPPL